MPNIFANMKPSADNQGRNVFPLDARRVYSSKVGQILGLKPIHFIPNDYMEIDVKDYALTFPMNTAAFLRGRKEFAMYRVDYNNLWSLFNQYIATRQDAKSSSFGTTQPIDTEPRLVLMQLYMYGLVLTAFRVFYENLYRIYMKADNISETTARKWAQMTRDKLYTLTYSAVFDTPDFNIYVLAPTDGDYSNTASTNITVDVLTVTWIEQLSIYSGVSADRLLQLPYANFADQILFDIQDVWRGDGVVRKLDLLGYGNILPLVKVMEREFETRFDLINSEMTIPNALSAVLDFPILSFQMAYPMCSSKGSFNSPIAWDSQDCYPRTVSPFPILAYNSVFYHYFRNSYYDNDYDVFNYNVDFYYVVGREHNYQLPIDLSYFSPRFLDIEYHQWKKDMFTGVMPSPYFGAVSNVQIDVASINDIYLNSQDFRPSPNAESLYVDSGGRVGQRTSNTGVTSTKFKVSNASVGSLGSSTLDVLALKRAEMIQNYKQKLLRAGNKTTDIFRAIYGKSPSSEFLTAPDFLDSFGQSIFVDTIVSQAETGTVNNGNLGDIAGRATIKTDGRVIKFHSGGDFGLLLPVCYIVPEAEYNSFMLDKHLTNLTPEDHFNPLFENLGLKSLISPFVNLYLSLKDVQFASLGYLPPYVEFKTDYDTVHGEFFDSVDLGLTGELNHWVSPRSKYQAEKSTSKRSFYINPSLLDNVFVRDADSTQSSDQFINDTVFIVKAVRNMSVLGFANFV